MSYIHNQCQISLFIITFTTERLITFAYSKSKRQYYVLLINIKDRVNAITENFSNMRTYRQEKDIKKLVIELAEAS